MLKATASFESSHIHQEESCSIIVYPNPVLRTMEYQCTNSPQTRHSSASGLKQYVYIARIGQGRPPPPDFAACISPVTATTERIMRKKIRLEDKRLNLKKDSIPSLFPSKEDIDAGSETWWNHRVNLMPLHKCPLL